MTPIVPIIRQPSGVKHLPISRAGPEGEEREKENERPRLQDTLGLFSPVREDSSEPTDEDFGAMERGNSVLPADSLQLTGQDPTEETQGGSMAVQVDEEETRVSFLKEEEEMGQRTGARPKRKSTGRLPKSFQDPK